MDLKEITVVLQDQEKLDPIQKISNPINALKTVAILQMIVWHCYFFIRFLPLQLHSGLIVRSFIEIGDFSGDMYALLSGFLLTYTLSHKNYDKNSWKKWYEKRIIRIYPIFIIATIAYVLYYYFIDGRLSSLNAIFIHMSGLQSIPTQPLAVFLRIESSHWFITFILICYAIFPIFYYFLKKNFRLTTIITIFLYIVYLVYSHAIYQGLKGGISMIFQENLYWWQFALTTLRYFDFLFGMIIGYYFAKKPQQILQFLQNRKVGLIAIVSFTILVFTYVLYNIWRYTLLDLPIILYNPLFALLFFIIIINVLQKNKRISKILGSPGKLLYEVFLFHPLIIFLTSNIFLDFLGIQRTIELIIILIPIIIIVSFIVAIPFYHLGELIKNRTKWHRTIMMFIIPLIIYGIISIVLDYSKGKLFDFGQVTNNFFALYLYITILIICILSYTSFALIKRISKDKIPVLLNSDS